jgi:hypothetical protein
VLDVRPKFVLCLALTSRIGIRVERQSQRIPRGPEGPRGTLLCDVTRRAAKLASGLPAPLSLQLSAGFDPATFRPLGRKF